MIEEEKTKIDEDSSLHSDILYALLIAINLNMATHKMNTRKQGERADEVTIQALSTSVQLPNVMAMSSALTMCARSLIVTKVIDFDTQFELMWNSHSTIQEQMDKETCKNFFVSTLDIDSNSIILNS